MNTKLEQIIPIKETIDGRECLIYRFCDDPFILFKYDIELFESFPMTKEEKDRGIRLCLEARIKNKWFGDILHPIHAV